MKVRSARTGKFGFVIHGASRIVAAPSMEKTKRQVASGSTLSDWRAVGDDLRRSMTKADVPVG